MVIIKLKSLRKVKGWSQTETAIKLGISVQTVKSIELNRKFVSREMLSKIYSKFNCSSFDEILENAS